MPPGFVLGKPFWGNPKALAPPEFAAAKETRPLEGDAVDGVLHAAMGNQVGQGALEGAFEALRLAQGVLGGRGPWWTGCCMPSGAGRAWAPGGGGPFPQGLVRQGHNPITSLTPTPPPRPPRTVTSTARRPSPSWAWTASSATTSCTSRWGAPALWCCASLCACCRVQASSRLRAAGGVSRTSRWALRPCDAAQACVLACVARGSLKAARRASYHVNHLRCHAPYHPPFNLERKSTSSTASRLVR